MQLALHCDDDGERFLLESKMLLYARTPEINADPTSPCILHENHNTRSEYASICLSCYSRLRERLARTEAALLIDLREIEIRKPTWRGKNERQRRFLLLFTPVIMFAGQPASMSVK